MNNKVEESRTQYRNLYIVFAVVLYASIMIRALAPAGKSKEVKFSQFAKHLEKGEYKSINITERKLTGIKKNDEKEISYAPSGLEIKLAGGEDTLPYGGGEEGRTRQQAA